MTQSSSASNLIVYFNTPSYNTATSLLTISNVQIIGNVGTIYFVLVITKQIAKLSNGNTVVNIRMNQPPSSKQILNCQNWQGLPADGCGRAIYTGVGPLTVTMSGVQANSLYQLYYVAAS